MPADATLPPGPTAPAAVQSPLLARDPAGALLRSRARYGPVFTLDLALVGEVVVAATPDAVALVVPGDPGRTHAGAARRGVLPQASAASMFGADGATHREVRDRAAPAFAPEAVEAQRAAMRARAAAHVDAWPVGRPFALLPRLRTLTEDLFVRHVLGVQDEGRARRLVRAVGAALRTPGNPPLTPPDRGQAPPLGPLFHLEVQRRLRPVRRILGEELAARRGGDGSGAADGPPPAGGGILSHVAATGMDADAALDELLVVMAAAQEPPAIALSSILDRLGRDPDLATAVLGAGPDAPLFSAAIAETLRLRPPAMASLRQLREPLTVGGHDLPAGTNVMVPFVLLHRDPEVFPDPDRYDPSRFLDAPAPPSFLPFGGGVRRCPAEPLAGVEFGAVVPTVLERLRLRPLSRRPERLVQRATVLVPQRSGLVLAERRRT